MVGTTLSSSSSSSSSLPKGSCVVTESDDGGDQCGRGVVRERAFGENRARVSNIRRAALKRVGAERSGRGVRKGRRRRRRRRRSVRVGCRGSGALETRWESENGHSRVVRFRRRSTRDLVGVLVATKASDMITYRRRRVSHSAGRGGLRRTQFPVR